MLTSTCLLHKAYLKMFHDANVLPRKMFDYIDKEMNCEDIGINMMVAKFLTDVNVPQPCLLSVKYKGQITNLEGAKGEYLLHESVECVCICVCVYMYVCVCVHIYVCVLVHVCVCVCTRVYVCVHVYACANAPKVEWMVWYALRGACKALMGSWYYCLK